jgi:hypothetical protein
MNNKTKLISLFVTLLLVACGPAPVDITLIDQEEFYIIEDFDYSDILLDVSYEDGEKATIPLEERYLTDEVIELFDQRGDHQIPIQLGELSKSFDIKMVFAKDIRSIELPESIINQRFIIQDFDWSDIQLIINKYDGTSERSTINESNVISPRQIEEGINRITLEYQGNELSVNLDFEHQLYDVRLFNYDGSLLQRSSIKHGTILRNLPTPEREGHTFISWDYDGYPVESELSVYPLFEIKTYTVDFIANGVLLDSQVVKYDDSANAPEVPTADGYVFDGWNQDFDKVRSDMRIEALFIERTYNASELYSLVIDSIVEVAVYNQNGEQISLGTGFVVEDGNTVITNYHVIEGGTFAQVESSTGRVLDVRNVIGYDKELDIAILQVSNLNLEPLKIATRPVTTGEVVIAIGSSLGFTGSVSEGIVATANRNFDGVNYVQMTAPISPGNSGGPLFNRFGEVIAINTLGLTEGNDLYLSVAISERLKVDRSNPMSLANVLTYEDPYALVPDPYDILFVEIEPNYTRDLATRLVNGTTLEGVIGVNDLDIFSFTPTTNGLFNAILIMEYNLDLIDTWFWIEDSQGNILQQAELSSSRESLLLTRVNLLANNTYYIGVLLKESYPYSVGADYTFYIYFG